MSDVLVTGLPPWVWGRLATIADNRNVTVDDLVAAAVLDVVDADTNRLAELDAEMRRVRALRKAARRNT